MKKGDDSKQQIKVSYQYVGKKDGSHLISSILRPTKITAYLVLALFLLSVLFGVFTMGMDFTSVSDDPDAVIMEVGYPYPMMIITNDSTSALPFDIKNILLDLIIFFIISYVINVAVNLAKRINVKSEEPTDTIKEIKVKKSLAEKGAKKIVESVEMTQKQKEEQALVQSEKTLELEPPKPTDI